MKHIIIGTAGHIDHGKTTLIKALTGRDTDTLKEERERGISINLGFTYFDLPSGKRAGIVDVPGHERFIKNMLAGVSGIDIVLMVIAADEGIMPQTREHLNILSLLDVKRGIVVLTKKDMVDSEWLDVVAEDVRNYLKGTFLENADIIPVSSVTGDGLDELIRRIDILSEEAAEKDTGSFFRLPVDRVFTVSGFGTVVTGTLISGIVNEGDRVIVYPSGTEVKVRTIQVHEQPVKSAFAGQRVAVNLSNIKVGEIERGYVVAEKGCMEPSLMIDCRLNYLMDAEKPLENRDRVRVYHGTSELLGRVVIIDREIVNPGDSCYVQIRLESPICARKGDKYVVRTYSPMLTIGGGTILDPNPPKRKRFDERAINELKTKEQGDPVEVIEHVVQKNSGLFPGTGIIAKLTGNREQDIISILNNLKAENKVVEFSVGEGPCYVHKEFINNIYEKMKVCLQQFYSKNPLKAGMAKEELKSRIFEKGIKQKLFDDILLLLESNKLIKTGSKHVALYNYEIKLSPAQSEIKNSLMKLFNTAGISVPKPEEAMASIKGDPGSIRMVFDMLMDAGELVKINEDMIISRDSFDKALDILKETVDNHGEITLAQYRDALGTSRKYAVSILEFFDQNKITKRVGDNRILN
jgi:selenocysteine-specific elongation factor